MGGVRAGPRVWGESRGQSLCSDFGWWGQLGEITRQILSPGQPLFARSPRGLTQDPWRHSTHCAKFTRSGSGWGLSRLVLLDREVRLCSLPQGHFKVPAVFSLKTGDGAGEGHPVPFSQLGEAFVCPSVRLGPGEPGCTVTPMGPRPKRHQTGPQTALCRGNTR